MSLCEGANNAGQNSMPLAQQKLEKTGQRDKTERSEEELLLVGF